MKVFLINPTSRNISEVDVQASKAAIQSLIGFNTVDVDQIDSNGDSLYFDEECFIRQQQVGRFKIDNLAPVAGLGVVVNTPDGGNTFLNPEIALSDLKKRTIFI